MFNFNNIFFEIHIKKIFLQRSQFLKYTPALTIKTND